jgi:probable HAF family extracellular repeat protein
MNYKNAGWETLERRVLLSAAYTFTDLGTLGGSQSEALAINAQGDVVGESITASGKTQAFLWLSSTRQMIDLGIASDTTTARAINAADEAVGDASSSRTTDRAIELQQTGTTLLSGVSSKNSAAMGVNNSGEIVGESLTSTGQMQATKFSARGASDLGTMGGPTSFATAINQAGDIVGQADTFDGAQNAFLLLNNSSTMQDIGTLGGLSCATAVNAYDMVVGYSYTNGGEQHAFMWQGGVLYDLGTFSGGTVSQANGVNDAGIVVGQANVSKSTATHAFADWGSGLVDLNTQMVAPGVTLDVASAINNAGQIVGTASINGQSHAFLLTPVAAPSGDVTPPQATLIYAPKVRREKATEQMMVTYSDNVDVNVDTLGHSEIQVTGPHGFIETAQTESISSTKNAPTITVTYEIIAPDRVWYSRDHGRYTILLNPAMVRDTSENAAVGGPLGTFGVDVPAPDAMPDAQSAQVVRPASVAQTISIPWMPTPPSSALSNLAADALQWLRND